VLASLERPRDDLAGQALTEYAILLALVAGLNWLEGLTRTITQAPLTAVLVGTAVVVVGLAFRGLGRR
jgi:hypothetical protein